MVFTRRLPRYHRGAIPAVEETHDYLNGSFKLPKLLLYDYGRTDFRNYLKIV